MIDWFIQSSYEIVILIFAVRIVIIIIEPIDKTKAIAKYNYGALIESNGEELAEKAMREFCNTKELRIITSGSRVSGEKRITVTTVFECID